MLRLRILSAVILAPPALLAVWLGSWAVAAVVAAVAAVLAWEWSRLCLGGFGRGGLALAVMGVAASALAVRWPLASLAMVAAAVPLVGLARPLPGRSRWWMAGGAVYIGLSCVALVWLRGHGRETVLWLLLVVWATDIGGYFAGRSIGGPKLMPSVSPAKTWSGLAGGMVLAAAVGWVAAAVLAAATVQRIELAALSALLAAVSQGGDLAESAAKRSFGVKDASSIIPGHGGVMDRVDGLLAAALVTAVMVLCGGGLETWR